MKICIYIVNFRIFLIVNQSFHLFYPIYVPFVKNSSQETFHCIKKNTEKSTVVLNE